MLALVSLALVLGQLGLGKHFVEALLLWGAWVGELGRMFAAVLWRSGIGCEFLS